MAENIAFILMESLAFGALLAGNVWLLWRQRHMFWQAIGGGLHLPPPDRPPPEVLAFPAGENFRNPPLPRVLLRAA